MKNKKTKFCLLMLVMVLGASGISTNPAFAKDDTTPVVTSEIDQDEIKANKETLEKAQASIDKKDFQSAIVYLTVYINSKPKKYEAYKLRGDAFYALHQFKLAENDYKKAIALKTDDDKFVTGTKVLSAVVLGADKQSQYQNPELGNLYGRLMYTQKALNNPSYEATYEKAFEYNSHIYLPKPKKEDVAKINCPQKYGKILNPQGVDEYIMDAISEIEQGQFHESVFKIQYITSNYPKYYLGHYLMGVAMAGMEQYDDAVRSYEEALKYNPYDFETFASLGQLYYRKAEKTFSADDAKKSIEYFNKAIRYNSNCHIYYYYIGLNNMILGDYDSAISNFDNAIKFKSNDYNSMYYKMIAQHVKGDFNSVVEGATNLLYRHVSNYNSVLYLRALAYHRLGNAEAALADLDKVHNNMNDIYNEDLKPLSKKEQTLSNYLFYLKAQILKEKGQGVKADLAKAYENPVISALANAGNTVPSNIRLTAKQVETEYDYIRTTFDNLNLSFAYENPDYKLVALNPVSNSVLADVEDVSGLKLTSSPEDKLLGGESSIAQMLASQSLGAIQTKVPSVAYEDVVKPIETETVERVEEISQQVPEVTQAVEDVAQEVAHEVEQVAENVAEKTVEEVQQVEKVAENVEDNIAQVEQVVEQEIKDVKSDVAEVVETTVQEVEEVQEVVEDNIEQVVEQATEDVEQVVKTVNEEVEETVTKVEDVAENAVTELEKAVEEVEKVVEEVVSKTPSSVVEKHAQVDLTEFNTVQSRKVLVLKDDDEIIELEPTSLKQIVEQQKPQVITPITSTQSNKIAEEIQKNQQLVAETAQQEVAKVDEIVAKTESTPVDVNITQSEMTTKVADVPAVVVPPVEIKVPEPEVAKVKVDEAVDTIAEVEQVEQVSETAQDVDDLLDLLEAQNSVEKNVREDKPAVVVEKPEVPAVAADVQPKEKKSWFGWFKRNKKEDISEKIDEVENIVEQEHLDDVSPELADFLDQIPSEDPTEEDLLDKQSKEENIPLIRTEKAEVPEVDEVEVKQEKKKFVWWWQRGKSEQVEQPEQSEQSEQECLPEEKTKSKKIDWKKFFTPEPKSEIKVVEPNLDDVVEENIEEEQKFVPTEQVEESFGQ
ncbi:hypothetical protein IJ472_06205 [bacterium]|nr:hypothetical protein [bacterium]